MSLQMKVGPFSLNYTQLQLSRATSPDFMHPLREAQLEGWHVAPLGWNPAASLRMCVTC